MKNNNGITIVALVVTIVVLLILAGVSINLVLGNNGVISKAKEAETKSGEASENDLNGMNRLIDKMESLLGGDIEPETIPYLPSDDFHYDTSTSVDTGLVIADTDENEYVWVVVPKSLYNNTTYNSNNDKKPSSSTDYANIEYCLQQYTATYRSKTRYSDVYYADDKNVGWFADETAYNNFKNSMLKSVYENGGFYVGRYEAGIGTNRTSKSATNSDGKYTIEGMPAPVSKADAYPYTYVTRTQAQNLASNVNSGTKTSSLMFGVQWDLVLKYLETKGTAQADLKEDSTSWGNYYNNLWNITNANSKYAILNTSNYTLGDWTSGAYGAKGSSSRILLSTGASDTFSKQGIYDFAGNAWEWTLERTYDYRVYCVYRGGAYDYDGNRCSAAYRTYNIPNTLDNNMSFRVSLF